jgi:hypothetical protein
MEILIKITAGHPMNRWLSNPELSKDVEELREYYETTLPQAEFDKNGELIDQGTTQAPGQSQA